MYIRKYFFTLLKMTILSIYFNFMRYRTAHNEMISIRLSYPKISSISHRGSFIALAQQVERFNALNGHFLNDCLTRLHILSCYSILDRISQTDVHTCLRPTQYSQNMAALQCVNKKFWKYAAIYKHIGNNC